VTELVDGCDVLLVKRTVVNEDSLLEVVLGAAVAVGGFVDEIRAVFGCRATDGKRKLATGVLTSVQDIDNSVTGLLARKTGPEDGGDVVVVGEGVDEHGSNRVNNDNGVVAQS